MPMPRRAIFIWQGRVLLYADLPNLALHSHQAAAIIVSVDPTRPFGLQLDENDAPNFLNAVLMPPRCPHALFFDGASAAFLFFDPGSIYFERIFQAIDRPIAFEDEGAIEAIRGIWKAGEIVTGSGLPPLLNRIPFDHPPVDIAELYGDARIRRVVAHILAHDDPDGTPRIEELAELADLSPSRLAHLFRERVGIPIRSLRTWFRLKAAVVHIKCGASLTDAAIAAGFYDQSHFTRVFRDMFGVPPSRVFDRGSETMDWYIEAEELTEQLAAGS